ncbi:hypothetical protein [Undibacterium sp. Jales W-56]|nr:hypothetical protein [Undibacterium sp. Jales W-56]
MPYFFVCGTLAISMHIALAEHNGPSTAGIANTHGTANANIA